MTTEVLRNMLLQTPWDVDDVDCVIFDEIHFLADPERGTTWEESIILCPEHVQLICLSATVSNAEEIAGWISRTHRPIRLITHYERAVPLSLYYFVDGKLHHGGRPRTAKLVATFPHTGGEARRQVGRRRRPAATFRARRSRAWTSRSRARSSTRLPRARCCLRSTSCSAATTARSSPSAWPPCAQDLVDTTPAQARIEAVIATYLAALRPEDHELEQVKIDHPAGAAGHRLPPRRAAADPEAARRSALRRAG